MQQAEGLLTRLNRRLQAWQKILFWDVILLGNVVLLLRIWNFLATEELNIPIDPAIMLWVLVVFNGLLILTPLAKSSRGILYEPGDDLLAAFGVVACDGILALLVVVLVDGWNAVVKESFLFDPGLYSLLIGGVLAMVNFLWVSYLRRDS